MHIAIITFEGFNELDSLIAFSILNRAKKFGWQVSIACPTPKVKSMNGVVLEAQLLLQDIDNVNAVLIGSGVSTREIVKDQALLKALKLNPAHQIIGAQCSGTLVLAKLGLLENVPACTDLFTKPWVQEAGVEVLNQPFFAKDNIATAGGCFASQYLAAWLIARLISIDEAEQAIYNVAPVGEKELYVSRAMNNILPFLVSTQQSKQYYSDEHRNQHQLG